MPKTMKASLVIEKSSSVVFQPGFIGGSCTRSTGSTLPSYSSCFRLLALLWVVWSGVWVCTCMNTEGVVWRKKYTPSHFFRNRAMADTFGLDDPKSFKGDLSDGVLLQSDSILSDDDDDAAWPSAQVSYCSE
jgi:hypothetical protein